MHKLSFCAVAGALLLGQACLQFMSVRTECQTYDEGIHLAAGVSYWQTGDYRLNQEHPPLAKLACALPVLATRVKLPLSSQAWENSDQCTFASEFLYRNELSAHELLPLGRLPTIAITMLGGATLAFWVRRRFGALSALVALALYALDPTITAHGRYITTDVWVTVFSFAACVAWGEALMTGKMRWYAASGVLLGMALASKFSAVFLVPVFFLLVFFRRPVWNKVPVTALLCGLSLAVMYAPEVSAGARSMITGASIDNPRLATPLSTKIQGESRAAKYLYRITDALGLPSYSWLVGLGRVALHSSRGHASSYLLGQISSQGWPHYFLVAFLVKTPTAVLVWCAAALVILILRHSRPSFELLVVSIPFLVYVTTAIASNLNIGIRHLLPAFPFMFVLLAVCAVRYFRPIVTAGLLVGLAVESLAIYPNYLAFFNWPSGGPNRGPEYLVDSNIDWGQDTLKLKNYLDANGLTSVCTSYFGQAHPKFHNIREVRLPTTSEYERGVQPNCIAAISVTHLQGAFVGREQYSYLREREPIAKIGYSIYLYDLLGTGGPASRPDFVSDASRSRRLRQLSAAAR